jgi:hypothetical protein
MGCKLFVALQLEVAHHFIERCALGRTRGFEPPGTLGTTKTPKTRLLKPYHLPAHGRLCRCAPTSTRLLPRDETFWFAINGSFRSGVLPDCSRKPSPSSGRDGRCVTGRSLHAPIWTVCRAPYIHGGFLFMRTPDFGASFEGADSFKCWFRRRAS